MTDSSASPTFHRAKIQAAFDDRRKRNPGYSLRSFARDLELSPSALSALLNGKKGLSKERARMIAQKLGLQRLEEKIFLLSVISCHGRSAQLRDEAKEMLQQTVEKHSSTDHFTKETLSELESWHDFALMEALELAHCKHTVKWFAHRLSLTEDQVKRAIKRLEDQKRIIFENGTYRALFVESSTGFDVPHETIKEYHSSLLTAARTALHKQPVQQREFLNMTLAFPQKEIKEAKNFIRDFQEQFAEKFYSKEKIKDSVYQLSIQLFRLDQED